MKNQKRDFEINYPFDWQYGVDLQQMKKDLEALEKLGATRIDIDASSYYDSLSVEIKAICTRLETDAECEARIKEEKLRKMENERRELEYFEKLKAKYGRDKDDKAK